MFEMQSQMNKQELFEFGEKSIQKTLNIEDYIEKRDENLTMDAGQLTSAYKKQEVLPQEMKGDMPQNDPQEKESTRRRRQKKRLADMGKQVNSERRKIENYNKRREQDIRSEGVLDQESLDVFQEVLKPEMFAPKYVLEHFKEIRQQLDVWKEHLRLFGEGGAGAECLSRDQQIRFEKMKTMYEDGERALESALAALGFQCEVTRSKDLKITEIKDPERIERALQENIRYRKNLQEQSNIDEQVVLQLMKEEEENQVPNVLGQREAYRNDKDYSFINTEHMSHFYHYDAVKNVKDMFEKYPEKYQENKAVLDKMYREVFNLAEVLGEYLIPAMVIEELKYNGMVSSSSKNVHGILREIQDQYSEKNKRIESRADCIIAGIKSILTGKSMTEVESLIAREFMKPGDELEQQRKAAESDAAIYADSYREKKAIYESLAEQMYGENAKEIISEKNGRYMMLMEPGQQEHNAEILKFLVTKTTAEKIIQLGGEEAKIAKEEMGRAAKPLVLPYLQRIRDYDTSMLANCTDEELMARSAELQELYMSSMQISDIAKNIDPDDPEGRTINEVFAGKEKELFTLKRALLQEYAVKARMLTMTRAYAKGVLTEKCFIPTEVGKIEEMHGLKRGEEINMGQMLSYVKSNLVKSEMRKDTAYNNYFKSEEAQSYNASLRETEYVSSHKNYDEKLKRVRSEGVKILNCKGDFMGADEIKAYYKILKAKAAEVSQKLQEEDETGMMTLELEEELHKLQEDMQMLNNEYALTRNRFRLAGEDTNLISEPIFRSYASSDGLDSFRNMGEENFETMCRQLSAGALEAEDATPEEIAAYREENRKGLLTYKKYMKEHYEMLEERFHHKAPSLEYIAEHYDEMEAMFGNVQVDTNLVDHSKDIIDWQNEEDIRFYHLVHTYNAMGAYILGFGIMSSFPDYKKGIEVNSNVMDKNAYTVEYLEQKQENLTLQERMEHFAQVSQRVEARRQEPRTAFQEKEDLKELEAAEARIVIGKFQTVRTDEHKAMGKDKKIKLNYLHQYAEMQSYRKKYESISSPTLGLFKRWSELKGTDVVNVGQSLFEEDYLKEVPQVLQNEDNLRKSLSSENSDEVVQALMELNKVNLITENKNITEADLKKVQTNPKNMVYQTVAKECIKDSLFGGNNEEKKLDFIHSLYSQFRETAQAVREEAAKFLPIIPEEILQEDKEAYAYCLANETEAGRKMASFKLIERQYLGDSKEMKDEITRWMEEKYPGMLEDIESTNEKLLEAKLKFQDFFEKAGLEQGVLKNQRLEFNKIFRN